MYIRESEYVTEEWVKSSQNYNMKSGGRGGFNHIMTNPKTNAKRLTKFREYCITRRRVRLTKNCKTCGISFTAEHDYYQTCSRTCGAILNNANRRQRKLECAGIEPASA